MFTSEQVAWLASDNLVDFLQTQQRVEVPEPHRLSIARKPPPHGGYKVNLESAMFKNYKAPDFGVSESVCCSLAYVKIDYPKTKFENH